MIHFVAKADEATHIVYFASLFCVRLRACDSSEAGKEPLSHGVDGVDSRDLAQLRSARGDVEA